ncbi:hypothetical protein BOSE46_170048 [Bosea sp. 46]|nr:hypothetical protein BOSE46_170048 [Bosea sp. 46]CAD5274412.1 hypothetical protein BOSE7B_40134 [Bosea sp. 7B]VXB54363.1 hypothetical protein BOSE127_130053 [Bosea sp. 127]VXB75404.1 hypothetical protein BOSE29B_120148 [Bosea sp. 29B]
MIFVNTERLLKSELNIGCLLI